MAAALVDVGRGAQADRADHAARTGRYVVPANTWVEVLEVYCAQCRAPYRRSLTLTHCPGLVTGHVDYDCAAAAAN